MCQLKINEIDELISALQKIKKNIAHPNYWEVGGEDKRIKFS